MSKQDKTQHQNKPRAILITGCSSGIGLCVADGLQKRGYRVFASARKQQDVDKLIAKGHEALLLDLNNEKSITQAVNTVMERCDRQLFALFNNGAYGQPGAVEDLTTDVLRRQFETNVFGWHELTRQVLPYMRQQGEGRIIQNSSVLGFVSLPFRGAYNSSKYALEGLTDTLRIELQGSGVQISLIEPGPITSRFRTNAHKKFLENIDPEHSYHKDTYDAMQARLTKQGAAVPFTLPADAVLKKVLHALESRRAKPRYYVTFPTYLFGSLKRILTSRALDRLIHRLFANGG